MAKAKKSYSTLIFMIMVTFTGKILGMVRDMIIANYYGSGASAEAFFTASKLPLNFFDFALGAAIGSAFIPVFNGIMKEEGEEEGIKFANEFVNVIMMTAIVIATLGMLFAPQLVKLMAADLQPQALEMAVALTTIMFPMLIFTAMAFTFVGILQSFGEFNVPAAISVMSNMVLIIYLLLFRERFGLEGLGVAMVIGWFMQMFVQLPFLKKNGYKYRPTWHFNRKHLSKVIVVMIPILISSWVQPINVLVNTRLASSIKGAIPILEYANRVFLIVAGVFVLAITNLVFPSMTKFIVSKDEEGFVGLVVQAIRMVVFFMTPMTVGICLFSPLITKLLYGRGAVSNNDIRMITGALIFYVLGIVFYGIREVMNKAYYSKGDTRTPLNIAVVGIVFNIALSIILIRIMSLYGLALAATLSALLMAIVLIAHFNKNVKQFINAHEVGYTIKTVLNSSVMGVIVYYANAILGKRFGRTSLVLEVLYAAVATVVGILVYFLVAKLIKLDIPTLKLHDKKVTEL